MHLSRSRARCARRYGAFLAVLATVGGTLIAAPAIAAAAPAPPPNPTNGQLSAAAAQKAAVNARVGALSTTVGRLSGQVAAAQAELGRLQVAAQLAEQKVALAVSRQHDAELVAAAAKAQVRTAAKTATNAHTHFVRYLQATYMDGQPQGTAGALLTAKDPTSLLNQGTLENYQAATKLDAIGTMERATVAKSNADAKARVAVQRLNTLTAAAKRVERAARTAVAAQQTQAANLRATQIATQASLNTASTQLSAAQAQYATLTGQRLQYNAYVAEQKRLAAIRAARIARERAAAAAAARAAALAAAARKTHHKSSSGGSGASTSSSGSSQESSAPAPSGGSWTAAKGRRAADRALDLLGVRYIFAGGNRYGPTDGGCTDPIASCGTLGYDCSGLVLYAWGASWAHYAATQYSQAGSYHPSSSHFKVGDLLFWSENGRQSGIGHVALYIGNGNVVQAPQSGERVKITPWDEVESGYYGATRPLT